MRLTSLPISSFSHLLFAICLPTSCLFGRYEATTTRFSRMLAECLHFTSHILPLSLALLLPHTSGLLAGTGPPLTAFCACSPNAPHFPPHILLLSLTSCLLGRYEATTNRFSRVLAKEAGLAGVASSLLGLGTLFLLLWAGVYV